MPLTMEQAEASLRRAALGYVTLSTSDATLAWQQLEAAALALARAHGYEFAGYAELTADRVLRADLAEAVDLLRIVLGDDTSAAHVDPSWRARALALLARRQAVGAVGGEP